MRWSQASRKSVSVVVLTAGALDGDMDSRSRDATIREVSGDSSVALVELGSASRATTALRGFLGPAAGCPMSPTALGVGVSGGGAVVRRLVGVLGVSPGEGALLLRALAADDSTGGNGGGMAVEDACACRPMRDDLLVTAMIADV